LWLRYYAAGGVLVGFLSHLVLDEIWSIGFRRGLPRLKKSFGTAVKIWGDNLWANVSTYAKVILLTYLVVQDPQWMAQFDSFERRSREIAEQALAASPTPHRVSHSAANPGEVSATPPIYYDLPRVGARPEPRPWR
jgi:hypothetical protein